MRRRAEHDVSLETIAKRLGEALNDLDYAPIDISVNSQEELRRSQEIDLVLDQAAGGIQEAMSALREALELIEEYKTDFGSLPRR